MKSNFIIRLQKQVLLVSLGILLLSSLLHTFSFASYAFSASPVSGKLYACVSSATAETTYYHMVISNEGTDIDSYTLVASSLWASTFYPEWGNRGVASTDAITQIIDLSPGASFEVFIGVVPPLGTPPGTNKNTQVTITSVNVPSNTVIAVFNTTVEAWASYRQHNNATRRSVYKGPSISGLKWKYATGSYVWSSPAIAPDGTIYFGSGQGDNKLYALNSNGTLKWSYTVGILYQNSPAIAPDGTVYIGSAGDGYLYAMNPDGTLKWRYFTSMDPHFATGGGIHASPAVGSDGTVYIGDLGAHTLYAINSDGTLKWSYVVGPDLTWVDNTPAIGPDGTIYVVANNNLMYAINTDGSLKWTIAVGNPASSPAVGPDGTIYQGSKAINPDGTLKWTCGIPCEVDSSPAIGPDGTIYVGAWDDHKFYAINPDGTIKWSYLTGNLIKSSPAIGSDGTIYFGSYDNIFYALNPNGTLKWSYTTGNTIIGSPAIGSDGTVYIGSHDSKLYAFGQLSVIRPNGGETVPALSHYPPITFSMSGTVDDIYIRLSMDGGASWTTLITHETNTRTYTGIGSYEWTVPMGLNTSLAMISIDAHTTDGYWYHDVSDAVFTITSPVSYAMTISPALSKLYASSSTATVEKAHYRVIISKGTTALDSYTLSASNNTPGWTSTFHTEWGDRGVPTTDAITQIDNFDADSSVEVFITVTPPLGAAVGTVNRTLITARSFNDLTRTYIATLESTVGNWTSLRQQSNTTRRSAYKGPSIGVLKWNYTTGNLFYSSPAIATDGTVYVGNYDGILYAMNSDGTLKWSYPTGATIISSPNIGPDGTVYVGSHNQNLYAINPDGTLKWSCPTGGLVWSSPAIGSDGTVYVGSYTDGKLNAINPNGTIKWTCTTGLINQASPAVAPDGTIYIGSWGDAKIYAINPDGTVKWSYYTYRNPAFGSGGGISGSPAIGSDGTIYIMDYGDGNLYAMNPDGTLKWKYISGSVYSESSPAIGQDGTIYVGIGDNKLHAVNPNGTLKWTFQTGGNIRGTPMIDSDGTIYAGSLDKNLYAINPDGSFKWNYATLGEFHSSPALGSDGVIYIGSWDDHNIIAIKTMDGLVITQPNGGELIPVGPAYPITFAMNDTVDNIYIRLSMDGGATWGSLITHETNTRTYTGSGTYNWLPALGQITTEAMISIDAHSISGIWYNDRSDAKFTITDHLPPSLEVWASYIYGLDQQGRGSYLNPYRTIAYALTNVATGGVVHASNEVFPEHDIQWPKFNNITLRGLGSNETVISGEALGRVITCDAAVNLTIESLTIKDGYSNSVTAQGGAAMRLTSAGSILNLRNVNFIANNAEGINADGGAIFSVGRVYADKCSFINNQCQASGGVGSGGIWEATNCIFAGNGAWGGGVFSTYGVSPPLPVGTYKVTNCTFYDNTGSVYGSIVYSGTIYATNCIFWGNTSTDNQLFNSTSGWVRYSDVQDGTVGTGNISSVEPLFVNAAAGDFHLLLTSECVNSGTFEGAPATDLDGVSRPQPQNPPNNFRYFDMGVYEQAGVLPYYYDVWASYTKGSNTTGAGTVDEPYQTIAYALTRVGTSGVVHASNEVFPEHDIPWSKFNNITLTGLNSMATIDANKTGGILSITNEVNATIEGITFRNASTEGEGGGIYCVRAYTLALTINVRDCKFLNNYAKGWNGGAGIACAGYSMNVDRCVFKNNTANYYGIGPELGAAIFSGSANEKVNISNSLFYNNKGGGFGALLLQGLRSSTVESCTFVSNEAVNGYGGGYANSCQFADSSFIRNSIFWDNSASNFPQSSQIYDSDFYGSFNNRVRVSYTDVQGGVSGVLKVRLLQGTTEAYPKFASRSEPNPGFLRLGPASPCMDTGTNEVKALIDLSGNTRPVGLGYDMGAYEFLGPSVRVTQPNGGESILTGQIYKITWMVSPAVDTVIARLSTNGGATWNSPLTIEVWPHSGVCTYEWTPVSNANNCLVSVEVNAGGIWNNDVSDATFEVITVLNLTLVTVEAPNGAEIYSGGSLQPVIWQAWAENGLAPNSITIKFSSNEGVTWQTLVTGVPTMPAYFNVLIPNVTSNKCLISVEAFDIGGNIGRDVSNATFTVTSILDTAPPDQVIIKRPDAGDVAVGATNFIITWEAHDVIATGDQLRTNLYYTTDEVVWTAIATDVAMVAGGIGGIGEYTWFVPPEYSNNCKIKAEVYDPTSNTTVKLSEKFKIGRGIGSRTFDIVRNNNGDLNYCSIPFGKTYINSTYGMAKSIGDKWIGKADFDYITVSLYGNDSKSPTDDTWYYYSGDWIMGSDYPIGTGDAIAVTLGTTNTTTITWTVSGEIADVGEISYDLYRNANGDLNRASVVWTRGTTDTYTIAQSIGTLWPSKADFDYLTVSIYSNDLKSPTDDTWYYYSGDWIMGSNYPINPGDVLNITLGTTTIPTHITGWH